MKRNYLIICILVCAAFLRLYRLSFIPPSPSLDEVSIGYNAYSILKTGMDEYGTRLPLFLRAYDDYRSAFYVYLVVPFIKLFGLNIFAVRLPSVLLSLVTVYILYCLIDIMFRTSYCHKLKGISCLLLAISPWHIYISRLGHEVNLGLTLTILGIYLFIKAVNGRNKYLVYSAIIFALSLNSYQSQKILTPLIICILILLYKKEILKIKKTAFLAFVCASIVAFPFIRLSLKSEGLTRLYATSVFYQHPAIQEAGQKFYLSKINNDFTGQLFYNKKVTVARIIASQYITHFQPKWLFLGGEKEDFKVPKLGLLNIWEIIFILIAFFSFIKNLHEKKLKSESARRSWYFILLFACISPIPAAISIGVPHAMRAYALVIPLTLFSAYGITLTLEKLDKRTGKTTSKLLYVLLITGSIIYTFYQYFYVFPKIHSSSFQYALNQAIGYVSRHKADYTKIIVSNRGALYQSYMFYLFHEKYSPFEYLKAGGTVSGGYNEPHVIGAILFQPIDWEKDKYLQNTLLVGNISDFPDNSLKEAVFKDLDNEEKIAIVKT